MAEINLHSKLCHYTVESVDNVWTNKHSCYETQIVYTPKNNSVLSMLKLVVREITTVVNRAKNYLSRSYCSTVHFRRIASIHQPTNAQ